jgi:hypothetical protein
MLTPEIVLIGGPNSGKTHYSGQLYGRLQRNPGVLSLRRAEGAPADLSAFQEVFRCLESGNAASHTPTDTWAEISLPLEDQAGHALDLRWPDYGGEQLKQILSTRSVNMDWQANLSAAKGWLLLIRLSSEVTYPDALEKLAEHPHCGEYAANRDNCWDANAYWVEKIQILLHVAKLGVVTPLQSPRLAVLLSCYDELGETNVAPAEELARKLPLVASFIRNNWYEDEVSVWGLSALGQPLTKSSGVEAFIDEGPEYQGWVMVPAGGERNIDLTLPLKWLLDGITK